MNRPGVISVLSAGPSLTRCDPAHITGTLIIAVHIAADVFPCHWLVCGDGDGRGPGVIAKRPDSDLFLSQTSVRQLDHAGLDYRIPNRQVLEFEDERIRAPIGLRWQVYSATAALVLAHHLGAKRVEAWGFDMAGHQHYDGTTIQQAKAPEIRWGNERVVYGGVVDWLLTNGTQVVRYL